MGGDRNSTHFEAAQNASDENTYYLGSPASMEEDSSCQYELMPPTDQDMVDCEFASCQLLSSVQYMRLTFAAYKIIRDLSES
jgi:hypothetical protein